MPSLAALRGVHHVGVTVRDLDLSRAWYRDVLGFEEEVCAEGGGPVLSRMVGLEDARLRFAFFRVGNVRLELLEYENPVGDDFELRNCDVGAVHLCFEVGEIDAVHARLREAGVEFATGPMPVEGGVFDGATFCYFRDPDGIQLELWQPGS